MSEAEDVMQCDAADEADWVDEATEAQGSDDTSPRCESPQESLQESGVRRSKRRKAVLAPSSPPPPSGVPEAETKPLTSHWTIARKASGTFVTAAQRTAAARRRYALQKKKYRALLRKRMPSRGKKVRRKFNSSHTVVHGTHRHLFSEDAVASLSSPKKQSRLSGKSVDWKEN